MKMKTVIRNSSCTCFPRFNQNPLLKSYYLQKKPQKLNELKQQKLKKYSAYNLRDFNKTITLKNYQSAKIYSPIRNIKNIRQNSDSNSNSKINNFHYLIKTNTSITKSPNYNCDNYQYFYNFYLNNSSPNTFAGNSNEANSTITQNYNPLYQTMAKTDNYRRNNTLNTKKKIYQRPKQKICTEMFINTNNDRRNNFTNFEIVYDNKPISPNFYTTNNTEYSNNLAKSMTIKKKFLMNNSVKEKKIETFRTSMVSNMSPTIDISSFNVYDNKFSIDNKYNKSTIDVKTVLKKKINFNDYITNKSSTDFYKLNNSETKIYVKKNNKIYNKKIDKKSNDFFNNTKYITKNSLYCKELKKFFSDIENSKSKNSENKKNSRSIFDNILNVHKNILLIQTFYRRHLSRVKFCILKIMSNFIEGFNLIEDVFYKQYFQKMKNQINNLYPKNNDYCIKTQERLIPKFNNKDFEKLNSFNFNSNKKMIYYCLELPSNNLNEKHNIIEDIAKGKIKIKNEKLSQIKNNYTEKKYETVGDINHSWEFDTNVNNDIETSNFTNVLNTEENNLERDKNEKTMTFSKTLFPKKYNKKLVKFKKIITTQK